MKPAAYDESVIYATRALFEGIASESQQKRFMEWLLFNACHIGQVSFDAANDRVSVFREGERHVGLQVARMREETALRPIKKARERAEVARQPKVFLVED